MPAPSAFRVVHEAQRQLSVADRKPVLQKLCRDFRHAADMEADSRRRDRLDTMHAGLHSELLEAGHADADQEQADALRRQWGIS